MNNRNVKKGMAQINEKVIVGELSRIKTAKKKSFESTTEQPTSPSLPFPLSLPSYARIRQVCVIR